MNWDKKGALEMADTRIINYSGKSLCDNYRNPLEKCETAAQAIRLYKNCISWALQERYPTKDELLSFASKETLAENGVYVDSEFNGERIDNHIVCVFINCKGKIRTGLNLKKAIIPKLYLSENSNMDIIVDYGLLAPIPIELYYNSRVKCNSDKISIKDYNHLTAKDNIGFTDEELSVNPNLDIEDL